MYLLSYEQFSTKQSIFNNENVTLTIWLNLKVEQITGY